MDNLGLRAAIERSKNNESYLNYQDSPPSDRFKQSPRGLPTNFLKSTKILQAYEDTVSKIVVDGLPRDQSIFNHAANSILKWQSSHKDEIAISASNYKRQFYNKDSVVDHSYRTSMHGSMQGDQVNYSPRPRRLEIRSKKQYKYKRSYNLDPSVFVGDPIRPTSNRRQQTDRQGFLAIEDAESVRFPDIKQANTGTNSERVDYHRVRHNHSRSMNPIHNEQYASNDYYQSGP